MKKYHFFVYITTNPKESTLYVGMTNNITRRLVEHYQNRGKPDSFAGKYYCYNLVYCEWHQYVYNAIARETELKKFTRQEKKDLIKLWNPEGRFLNKDHCGVWPPDKALLEALAKLPEEEE